MTFDVTKLNLKTVIKALYAYSRTINIGEVEYQVRRLNKENVDGLTDEECDSLLVDFYRTNLGEVKVADYYKGKPLKLFLERKRNMRILLHTDSYDSRNGLFTSFEALLDTFFVEDILIVRKGFKPYVKYDIPSKFVLSKEKEKEFKGILKNCIKDRNEYGDYWRINNDEFDYEPLYLRLLKK